MVQHRAKTAEAFGRRCIPKILEILVERHEDDTILTETLSLLIEKLHDPTVRAEVRMKNGAEGLIPLLDRSREQLIPFVCRAIELLADTAEGRQQLLNAGVLPALLQVSSTDPLRVTHALQSLLVYSDVREASVRHLAELIGFVKTLLNNCPDLSILEQCLHVLRELGRTKEGMEVCLRSGIPTAVSEIVLSLPEDWEKGHELVAEASAGYYREVTTVSKGRVAVRDCGGIKALSKLLEHDCARLRSRVTAAVASLSIDIPSKKLISENCLRHLKPLLLESTDPVVKENSRAALMICCEDPSAGQMIKTHLDPFIAEHELGPLPCFATRI